MLLMLQVDELRQAMGLAERPQAGSRQPARQDKDDWKRGVPTRNGSSDRDDYLPLVGAVPGEMDRFPAGAKKLPAAAPKFPARPAQGIC
jgi:hypothetical protein